MDKYTVTVRHINGDVTSYTVLTNRGAFAATEIAMRMWHDDKHLPSEARLVICTKGK